MATILVVDDEPLIRMNLTDELLALGHAVIECGNVLEAIAAFASAPQIDAVVTDVDMPGGLSGLDLVRMISQTRPSLPVWVTSGRDLSELVPAPASFLSKPYDYRSLASVVTPTCAARQSFGAHTKISGIG